MNPEERSVYNAFVSAGAAILDRYLREGYDVPFASRKLHDAALEFVALSVPDRYRPELIGTRWRHLDDDLTVEVRVCWGEDGRITVRCVEGRCVGAEWPSQCSSLERGYRRV